MALGLATGEPTHVAPQALLAAFPVFAYLVVVPSLIGFPLLTWLLSKIRVDIVNTVAYVAPVIALALGYLLLSEQVMTRTLGGVAVILAGVALMVWSGGRTGSTVAGERELPVQLNTGNSWRREAPTVERKAGGRSVEITRNSTETMKGSSDWFTGEVYIDTVAAPSEDSRIGAACVHFAPSARTAWHTHPHGQTIWVTEGVGLCQREGGPVEVIRPGDRVFFEPGENHWHGAAATHFMSHIAMQQANHAGEVVTWGEHVSAEQYSHAPSITEGEN